jgi:hypothetical protein
LIKILFPQSKKGFIAQAVEDRRESDVSIYAFVAKYITLDKPEKLDRFREPTKKFPVSKRSSYNKRVYFKLN